MKLAILSLLIIFNSYATVFNKQLFESDIKEVSKYLEPQKAQELQQIKNSILDEVTEMEMSAIATEQTFFGKLFSKLGLFLGKVHMASSKHSAWTSGWLTGFYEKKFKKNKDKFREKNKTAKQTKEFLEQVYLGAQEEHDEFIMDVINRIDAKEEVTAGEIAKLFELAPQYRFRFYEHVLTHTIKYSVPTTAFSLILKSLKNVPGIALIAIDAAFFISYLPCLKFPRKKPHLHSYCKEQEENYLTKVHYSRIRGYIKGSTKKK